MNIEKKETRQEPRTEREMDTRKERRGVEEWRGGTNSRGKLGI